MSTAASLLEVAVLVPHAEVGLSVCGSLGWFVESLEIEAEDAGSFRHLTMPLWNAAALGSVKFGEPVPPDGHPVSPMTSCLLPT